MIYAQIKNNIVINVIAGDESFDAARFIQGYDSVVRIDHLPVRPEIGASHDGVNFTNPEKIPVEPVRVKALVDILKGKGVITNDDVSSGNL